MVGRRFEVGQIFLFESSLETADAPSTGAKPAVVGEHLLGRLELAHGHPIRFDQRLRLGIAEQIGAHDEARVIIHKG